MTKEIEAALNKYKDTEMSKESLCQVKKDVLDCLSSKLEEQFDPLHLNITVEIEK